MIEKVASSDIRVVVVVIGQVGKTHFQIEIADEFGIPASRIVISFVRGIYGPLPAVDLITSDPTFVRRITIVGVSIAVIAAIVAIGGIKAKASRH
ncbi:MAG: hypothetical protein M5R36_23005 [Deltaproteobacteria bacterium]|nr:hypothetical protein [Deltaproteobacteria bacterium]